MKALMVAGEASGDLYGGRLASALQRRMPGLHISGMGGGQMAAAGVELLQHYGDVAVVGVFEVVSKLTKLHRAFSRIRQWVAQNKPAFAVLIDFPDFNFRVARFLKENGVKVLYFISPQIWAWRRNRIHFLKQNVDLMICVLPFEEELYRNAGVPVEYVGHPLVEIVQEQLRNQPAFARSGVPLLGIMPGSREVEVRRHLPILLETLSMLQKEREINTVLIWPPWLPEQDHLIPDTVFVVKENRYAAMKACDLLIVASGTSTLECAILEAPLFVVYKVSALSWVLGKILVRVPYYGLVNWIAQEKIIPEFIQSRMNPELLSREAARFLDAPAEQQRIRADLRKIAASLKAEGALDRAVSAITRALE